MAGGRFPLERKDTRGMKLLEAARLVEEVRNALWDGIYSGEDGQFDNAASDGGSMALLKLAATLIEDAVEQAEVKP